jgi:hypothetical protein
LAPAYSRSRLPGTDNERVDIVNRPFGKDYAYGLVGIDSFHACDRSRIPPEGLYALVGDLARKGSSGTSGRLFLKVKGLRARGLRREQSSRHGRCCDPNFPIFACHAHLPFRDCQIPRAYRRRVHVCVLHRGQTMQPLRRK